MSTHQSPQPCTPGAPTLHLHFHPDDGKVGHCPPSTACCLPFCRELRPACLSHCARPRRQGHRDLGHTELTSRPLGTSFLTPRPLLLLRWGRGPTADAEGLPEKGLSPGQVPAAAPWGLPHHSDRHWAWCLGLHSLCPAPAQRWRPVPRGRRRASPGRLGTHAGRVALMGPGLWTRLSCGGRHAPSSRRVDSRSPRLVQAGHGYSLTFQGCEQ